MSKVTQKKKNHHYKLLFKSFSLVVSFFLSFLLLVASINPVFSRLSETNIKIMGFGPLRGESGKPVAAQLLNNETMVVFDALKLAIIQLNLDGSFVNAFSIAEHIEKSFQYFSFRTSSDGYIYLQLQDQLFIFSSSGQLVKKISLHIFQGYTSGNTFILPIKNHHLLFFNQITLQYTILNIENPHTSIDITFDATGFRFADFFSDSQHIFLLGAMRNTTGAETYHIMVLSHTGDFIQNISVPSDIIIAPARLSVAPGQQLFLLNEQFHYGIIDTQGNALYSGFIDLPSHQFLSTNFCSLDDRSFLIPHIKEGLLKFSNDALESIFLPVKSTGQQILSVNAVSANQQFLTAFDSIAERFIVFQGTQLLRSFYIDDLPIQVSHQYNVKLYAAGQWIYMVIDGNNLSLLKYNPLDGQIHNIRLAEYISPRSYAYVRPEDGRIFIYSWFDGILYSFNEGDPAPEKTQIKRHESAMNAQDSICKVDSSGNIFILLSKLNRMNVYSKDGSLLFSFQTSNEASQIADFHFLDDFLILLNQEKGKIHILSKRGEELDLIGSQGYILYPSNANGYQEQKGLFFQPTSLFCFEGSIYVADTGNSRIQIIRLASSVQKTVIELQIGSPSAYINGQRISLDAPPFIESGRTLVPLRFIGEAFGAQVEWFAQERKAIISLGKDVIEVTIGETLALINGEAHLLDVPALIRQGRTFVPLRFIGEAFGASIVWEAESKRVIITYPGY